MGSLSGKADAFGLKLCIELVMAVNTHLQERNGTCIVIASVGSSTR